MFDGRDLPDVPIRGNPQSSTRNTADDDVECTPRLGSAPRLVGLHRTSALVAGRKARLVLAQPPATVVGSSYWATGGRGSNRQRVGQQTAADRRHLEPCRLLYG